MMTFTEKLHSLIEEELKVDSDTLAQNITISMQDAAPTIILFRAQDGYARLAAEKSNGKMVMMND